MKILQSASKIAFLALIFTACAGFIMKILPIDQFMLLAVAASSFYFAAKPTNTDGEITK